MYKLILISLILFTSVTVKSEEYPSVYALGYSKHLVEGDYNETHNYFAVEWHNFHVGTFNNSYNNQSYIVSYNLEIWENSNFTVGGLSGFVHGYHKDKVNIPMIKGMMPVIVPYVKYTKYKVKPTVGLLGQAVFITFEIDFN